MSTPWTVERPYTVTDRFTSVTTRAFAKVFRFDKAPLAIVGQVDATHLQGAGAVVAMTHVKGMGTASGTWTLAVKPGSVDFEKEVSVGDWVSLWWTRDGRKIHGTLGNIDDIRRGTRVVNGATVNVFMVTGRDIGKVFERVEVWFDEFKGTQSNLGGERIGARMEHVPYGSPDKVVAAVIDAFMQTDGNIGGVFRWPIGLESLGDHFTNACLFRVGGTKLDAARKLANGDLTRIGVVSDATIPFAAPAIRDRRSFLRGERAAEINLFQPRNGTRLSDSLAEWSNEILNELFYDVHVEDDSLSPVESPHPIVTVRERPFVNAVLGSQSPWFRLPTITLRRHELGDMDLGHSDNERVNLFLIYGIAGLQASTDNYVLSPPAYDLEDVRRHGLCRWERSTIFTGLGDAGDGFTWSGEIADWHSLVTSWYSPNHLWLNGSIMVKTILPEARIGYRVVVEGEKASERTQAYVENVRTSWAFPAGGTTTLGVTRGFRGSDAELVTMVQERTAAFQRAAVLGNSTAALAKPSGG